MKKSRNHIFLLFLLLGLTHFRTCLAANKDGCDSLYIEAKERNKQYPELARWKNYPVNTVESLGYSITEPDFTNRYGSSALAPHFKASGFFRVSQHKDRWYMIDPDGYLHIDAAVVGVRQGKGETNKKALIKKYGNTLTWINSTIHELVSFGFNGAGCWSEETSIQEFNRHNTQTVFTYCPILNLMAGYGRELKITRQLAGNTGYPNQCIPVFGPGFREYCKRQIPLKIESYKQDPAVIGYFSDNELPFGKHNLEGYLDLPESDPGHQAAKEWLRKQGVSREAITDELRDKFAGYVAHTYYQIVSDLLKLYDPNHMYLGSRLHGSAKFIKEIFEAAGRFCDIISINYYGFWKVRRSDMQNWVQWTNTPFMITEFYTKGEDSGLANTSGAGWTVHTQRDRGIHYENFILGLLSCKNCVGWSWFKYQDNDPTARGVDPSNIDSNKGCYDNIYNPYKDLTKRMQLINRIRYKVIELFDQTTTCP